MPRLALKLAFRLVLALLCLLIVPNGSTWAQYDDATPWEVEAAEYEALVEALDGLGLNLDSPELDGLDNGELWSLIGRLKSAPAAEITVAAPNEAGQ